MSKKIEIVERIDFIEKNCAGKKVLHLGCTNYPYTQVTIDSGALLHLKLEKIAAEVYGFDLDQRGLDVLADNGAKNLFRADLEKLEEVALDKKFDVIIAGEMIEHLNNPGLFLHGIKRFMNADTNLIITTINAYCAMRFWGYFLRGRGGVSEPVHPDHVAYYSYSTLKVLLNRAGLNTKDFLFYDLGAEHRPHSRWYYNFINDVSVWFSPQTSDGIIAVCGLEALEK